MKYPLTLDLTRSRPTLVWENDSKREKKFSTTDDAHEWARSHGYYIKNYIEFDLPASAIYPGATCTYY